MTPAPGRWRRAGLVLIGLMLYLLFLVATLPAHWAGTWLQRTSRGMVILEQPAGTFWTGTATLVLGASSAAPFRQRIGWDLHPLWLVTGRLRATLDAPDSNVLQARATVSFRQAELDHLRLELPASVIAAVYSPASLLSPTGTLLVESESVAAGSGGVHGEVRITWRGAGGRFGGIGEIGDYLLVANGQDRDVVFRIQTLRGDIRIEAQGSWQILNGGTVNVGGTIAAGSQHPGAATLLPLLNARPEGDHHRFSTTTRLVLPGFP